MELHTLPARQRLGEILVKHKFCGIAEVHDACAKARASSRRIGSVLVETDIISEKNLVATLAEQYESLPLFSLSGHRISPWIRNIFSLESALLHKTLFFDLSEQSMSMASPDPAFSYFFKAMLVAGKSFITPCVTPVTLFIRAAILTYMGSGPASIGYSDVSLPKLSPVIPDSIRKAVMHYLTRYSKTLVFDKGGFNLIDGKADIQTFAIIDAAWMLGAISMSADGAVSLCGESIHFRYDSRKLRRKIEDFLRKSDCLFDLMRCAALLGANIE